MLGRFLRRCITLHPKIPNQREGVAMGKIGICSLCLEMRRLSFEHTPPRRVFNNRPEVAYTVYGLGLGSAHQKPPVLLSCPRGLGRPTLCEGCNGKTADLYGN